MSKLLQAVTLAVTLASIFSDEALARMVHIIEKRDVSPYPADVIRVGATVQKSWAESPWFADPVTKSIQPCGYKVNYRIQMAECASNNR